MKNMKLSHKTMMIIGGVFLVLFIASGYWLLFGRRAAINNNNNQVVPSEAIIPTVSSSVKVNLVTLTGGHDVSLNVSGIPSGTTSIDYELSYQTAQQGLQGVIGTITPNSGESTFEKKLTLGTCSSGTCVYHQVVGQIKVTLKFTTDSGQQIFEKEFSL